ncbi:hypothetical protein [Alteraurantiacibacter aquimixticola]|uniref:Glycosyltransferase RgtA/B/C/D-like domain-containing protein n=1 Tax=Alteraurantiacibacter aquimixticola TaxID=2489173 RepID=A0A4T3EX04_9SPHN|nr:hypothetical protein [Alteraurantiacibacter aquimixticola]TIX49033.1 hypothetical protein E5222_14995 [Alteraurantiacibacter aquimixticola]
MQRPALAFIACLLLALATRAHGFGNPALHVDENWYLFVGQRLAAGDMLYVDIWDRKPPGLFAIYWLAGLSPWPVLTYQLMACLAAAGTAFLIFRMARKMADPPAALVSAFLYLALLVQLGGAGGQSPVFYNLLIAAAALLVGFDQGGSAVPTRRHFLAMLLAGCAIIVKPTAGFEAIFLGLWLLWGMRRAGLGLSQLAMRGAMLALAGLAPALAVAGLFAAMGAFEAFWQATVESSFAKEAQIADPMRWRRFALVWVVIALPLALAILGLAIRHGRLRGDHRAFMAGWIVAAMVGVVAVPNFYNHYLLPLFVPLCVAASGFFQRGAMMALVGVAGALLALSGEQVWNFTRTAQARASYGELADAVRSADTSRGMLVYDAPPSLYAEAGSAPLSPLSFPGHLWDRFEAGVSGIDTSAEMRRILAQRPGVVVTGRETSDLSTNLDTRRQLEAYLESCEIVATASIPGWTPVELLDVHANCGDSADSPQPAAPTP